MATAPEDKRIAVVAKQVSPIVEQAKSIVIKDLKGMEAATELLSQVNTKLDEIEKEKGEIIDPAKAIIKKEKARWEPWESVLEEAKDILRKGMSAYQTEAKRIADKKQADILARAKPGKGNLSLEKAVEKIENIDTPAATVATESGSLKFRTDKKFEVMDMTMLPLEYHLADEVAIRKAMKEGVELPGVRYYTEEVPINSRA